MDAYAPTMMSVGARGMIGKGARLPEVVEAMKKYHGVYFGAIGGAGALLAKCIKKAELIAWCETNKEILKNHFLCGTGTTARMITDQTGLPVRGYNSGPLGGDQQIGAKIVEGQIDFMIFLWDPLEAQPYDPDVKALLRIAVVYDICLLYTSDAADD